MGVARMKLTVIGYMLLTIGVGPQGTYYAEDGPFSFDQCDRARIALIAKIVKWHPRAPVSVVCEPVFRRDKRA